MQSINELKNRLPLVSIIMPVYKTENYLTDAIISVINQSYTNIELIIVDDGSPDDSYLIAEKYKKQDRRVYLIRQSNMGLSGARNTGLSYCKGEYIMFLDSDDTLVNDAIERLFRKAVDDNADIVVSDRFTKVFEETGTRSMCYHFIDSREYTTPLVFALNVIIGKGRAWNAWGSLYKTSIIKEHNLTFPLGYTAEDIVFNLLFLTYAQKISIINSGVINYLQRNASITKSFNPKLVNTYLFIDHNVEKFLINNNCHNEHDLNLRDSLLCRNSILLITSFMSTRNAVSFQEKIRQVKNIFAIQRYKESFSSNKVFEPYFDSYLAVMYFKAMYYLIKFRICFPVYCLAWFVGIVSNKAHRTF